MRRLDQLSWCKKPNSKVKSIALHKNDENPKITADGFAVRGNFLKIKQFSII